LNFFIVSHSFPQMREIVPRQPSKANRVSDTPLRSGCPGLPASTMRFGGLTSRWQVVAATLLLLALSSVEC